MNVYVNEQYMPFQSEFFELQDGDEKEMNVPMEKLPQGIYGKVTDQDGDPVAGATVTLEQDRWRASVETDEYGNYEVRVPAEDASVVTAEGLRREISSYR